MARAYDPEDLKVARLLTPAVADFAGSLLVSAAADPNIRQNVINKSLGADGGLGESAHAFLINPSTKRFDISARARGGNLIRLSGLNVPIPGEYVVHDPNITLTTRVVALIAGRYEDMESDYAPGRPLRIEVSKHNSTDEFDEFLAESGSNGTVNTLYNLDTSRGQPFKETRMTGIPLNASTDTLTRKVSHESKPYGVDLTLRTLSIESPMTTEDISLLYFSLVVMDQTMRDSGIAVRRAEFGKELPPWLR
jgi:hypothetical protein